MNILITGLAGCGKSTIAKKLKDEGYNSYDIESIDGLFKMVENQWICDIKKLKELIRIGSTNEFNFYCGMGSNIYDLLPFFDKVCLLVADKETTLKRLRKRKNDDQYGHTEEIRQDLISWKEDWEMKILKEGLIKIDASEPPEKVIKSILNIL
jgi:dephospho-CoA kinase